jgi:hypothetical protein
VYLADLVRHPGVVQNSLGSRRLAGIDVSHDADVSRLLDWNVTSHTSSKPILLASGGAHSYLPG